MRTYANRGLNITRLSIDSIVPVGAILTDDPRSGQSLIVNEVKNIIDSKWCKIYDVVCSYEADDDITRIANDTTLHVSCGRCIGEYESSSDYGKLIVEEFKDYIDDYK